MLYGLEKCDGRGGCVLQLSYSLYELLMFQSTIDGTVELKNVSTTDEVDLLMETKPGTYNSHGTLGLELHKKFIPEWDTLTPEQHTAINYWFKESPIALRRAQEKRAEDKLRAKGTSGVRKKSTNPLFRD